MVRFAEIPISAEADCSFFLIYIYIFFRNMSILKIHAREIFDSRGNPTVEVDLYTDRGDFP